MNIGEVVDKLIFFGFGIYCIFLSKKNKEKLGEKAALLKLCGIIFIVIGIIFSLMALFK